MVRDEVFANRYNIVANIPGEIDDPNLVYICDLFVWVVIGDRSGAVFHFELEPSPDRWFDTVQLVIH